MLHLSGVLSWDRRGLTVGTHCGELAHRINTSNNQTNTNQPYLKPTQHLPCARHSPSAALPGGAPPSMSQTG